MENFESVCDHLKASQPVNPVLCHRPHAAARSARWFLENFPGDVLYAVKANPAPLILDTLYNAGIRHFDIASVNELKLVHHYVGARLYCMNTVKHPEHIRQMYFDYGVRDFSLDCIKELDKILASTGQATDLRLHVRITVDNTTLWTKSSARIRMKQSNCCLLHVPWRKNWVCHFMLGRRP